MDDPPLLFHIFFYKTIGSLFRYRRDRSSFKHMSFAKEFLRIPMRLVLIFAGKVQVNIRRLVSIKSQEGFKRDVMPVPLIRRSAHGTVFGWKVKSRTVGTVGDKFTVLAVGADVMGRQRIDLRNSSHRCYK